MKKLMCISDIHGNIDCLKKALDRFSQEKADKLIILGDFSGYGFLSSSDFEVAEILNNMAGSIIAVKGNCDSQRADDLFNFALPYTRDISFNNITITITHGHIYNRNNLPESCGKIFISGHSHIGSLEKIGKNIIANPGSAPFFLVKLIIVIKYFLNFPIFTSKAYTFIHTADKGSLSFELALHTVQAESFQTGVQVLLQAHQYWTHS